MSTQHSSSDAALAVIGAGALARLVGMMATLGAGFASTVLGVRYLGASAYGVLAYGLAVLTLISASTQGIGMGITQHVAFQSETRGNEEVWRLGAAAMTAGAGLALVGSALAAFLLILPGTSPPALILGLSVLFVGLTLAWVASSVARALQHIFVMEALPALIPLGQLLCMVILVVSQHGTLRSLGRYYAALGGVAVAMSAVMVARLTSSGKRLRRSSAREAARLVRTTAPFAVVGLASLVIARFDVFVLGLSAHRAQVGTYEPTLKAVEGLAYVVPTLLMAIFIPTATRVMTRSGRLALQDLYLRLTKLGFVLGLPAVLLLAGFPGLVLSSLFGSDFLVHRAVVWLLLPGYVTNLALGLNWGTLAALNERNSLMRVSFSGLIIMVLAAVALIPAFGATGAAAATSLGVLVVNVVASVMLFGRYRLHPFRGDVMVVIASSAIPLVVVCSLATLTRLPSPQALGVTVGAWALWLGGLVTARLITRQEVRPLFEAFRNGRVPSVGDSRSRADSD